VAEFAKNNLSAALDQILSKNLLEYESSQKKEDFTIDDVIRLSIEQAYDSVEEEFL
jgi:hypothetical protein